jgi:hypothetical protein
MFTAKREYRRSTAEVVNFRAHPIHTIVVLYSEVGAMNIIKILTSEPSRMRLNIFGTWRSPKFHVSENMAR